MTRRDLKRLRQLKEDRETMGEALDWLPVPVSEILSKLGRIDAEIAYLTHCRKL